MDGAKIKLLKFVNLFEIGGTERHVVSLATQLDRDRFDIHMACLQRSGPFLKDLEESNISVTEYSISSLRSRRALQQVLRCARQIRKNRISIVHTYGFYANSFGVPAAKLGGASVVIASIRDMGDIASPAQQRIQKLVCRMADCILVNAEAIQKKLVACGYNERKIEVIKNGLDLSRFGGKPADGKFRRELGLPPGTPLVVVLSRLSRFKGIEYFLQAAASIHQRCREARFVIVGNLNDDSAYTATLRRRALELGLEGRMFFTGFRLDVPDVLSEVAVSVLPTLSEGLSNSLLESMAAGVPVVATRVGGNVELVEEGKTGLLVPPRDAEALAAAICLLLNNPEMARMLGAAAKKRVAEEFSIDRMVQETQDLYLNLLAKTNEYRATGLEVESSLNAGRRSQKPLTPPP